jgi:uncharacterized 2Fe-2S/4Fe-4S cluster protein (DUF4445 family)
MQIETDGVMPEIPETADQDCSPADVGIAVDIGTTTIAAAAYLRSTRRLLAVAAEQNNQVRYGYDVIHRVSFAQRPPLAGSSTVVAETGAVILHNTVISQLEHLFAKVLASASQVLPRGVRPVVSSIVITGNTTMLSLAVGVPVNGLSEAPFAPASLFGMETTWDALRKGTVVPNSGKADISSPEQLQLFESSAISEETSVYIPPCISAFVGADTVCAMIVAGFPVPGVNVAMDDLLPDESPLTAPLLLADIGTNCELALYTPGKEGQNARLICTSAAAGPAFEASNISCGMSSVDGAIDRVTIENEKIACRVIGGGTAKGLCGTGLLSLVALLFKNGYIDKGGTIVKGASRSGDGSACIELTPAVRLLQQDIRNLQLAKSAVRTGIQYLLEKSPAPPVFSLAGGFGANLSIEDACTLGLIPGELGLHCIHLGNAALSGAASLLFSPSLREKAAQIAAKAYPVNLAAVPGFQQRFLSAIDF